MTVDRVEIVEHVLATEGAMFSSRLPITRYAVRSYRRGLAEEIVKALELAEKGAVATPEARERRSRRRRGF